MESNIFAFGFVFSNFRNTAQIKKRKKNNQVTRTKPDHGSYTSSDWFIIHFVQVVFG